MTTCQMSTRWNPKTARGEMVARFSDGREIVWPCPVSFDQHGKPFTPDRLAVSLRDFANAIQDAARIDLGA